MVCLFGFYQVAFSDHPLEDAQVGGVEPLLVRREVRLHVRFYFVVGGAGGAVELRDGSDDAFCVRSLLRGSDRGTASRGVFIFGLFDNFVM